MKTEKILSQVKSMYGTALTNHNNLMISSDSSWVISNQQNRKSINIINSVKILGIQISKKLKNVSVEQFFQLAKKSKKELKVALPIINKYLNQIEKAEKMGQIALVEKLKENIDIIKQEIKAIEQGITEYLDAESIDKLLARASKNIKITFVKNYSLFIPDCFYEIKERLDKAKVFDDYVIIHYDPNNKHATLTKKEIEKKKDPILFGLIKGSKKFYYIGDWIDEYCDLTLEEAVKIINDGSEVIKKIKGK